MKRNWIVLLLTLALLCAVLAGCGGDAAPDEPEDLPGSDWRTWGLVNDYGTIIRDGEETSVLVCLDESGATFYYDDATQTVYDSVAFPAEIPDVWYLYTSISFDDRNGDGQSDVCMDFHENEDSEAVYIWYWDAEQGYVFQPDISTVSRYAADGSKQYVPQLLLMLDGQWQDALGETLLLSAERMQYIAASSESLSSGTFNDKQDGSGPYLFLNGYAYIELSPDGNSFMLSFAASETQSPDGTFAGVFYRDGDVAAYADLSKASFYENGEDVPGVWYTDGVNHFYLGEDYTIGEDGLAYDGNGRVFGAGWAPDTAYDPSVDWGEGWSDSWD